MHSPSVQSKPEPLAYLPIADATDRVLVVGGGAWTLDILRLATIRSDDVVLIAATIDDATRRHVDRFAIEWIGRPGTPADVGDFTTVLVAVDDVQDANRLVRAARRAHIPIHVADRPLVSDFSLLEFFERRPAPAKAL